MGSFTLTPGEEGPNDGLPPQKNAQTHSRGHGALTSAPLPAFSPPHAPPPAAGVAYTDLSRCDPPTRGPLFDSGSSGVSVRDVWPQRGLRGGCQDLIQLLCTAKGGTISTTCTLNLLHPRAPHAESS